MKLLQESCETELFFKLEAKQGIDDYRWVTLM